MKKFLQKKLNQKGLTLVELLAVIVILGIIAAIAVPAIGNIIENTKYNAVKSDALNALSAANLYFAEQPKAKEITVKDLVDGGYLDANGKLTNGNKITKDDKNNLTISETSAEYVSGKSVIFSGASVTDINDDDQKGSTSGSKTIPKDK